MLTLRKLQVVRVATAALLESQSPVLQRFWQGGNEDSASSSAKVLASVKMPWLARAQSTQIETASPSAGVGETAEDVPIGGEAEDDAPLPQFIYQTKVKRDPVSLKAAIDFAKEQAGAKPRKFVETLDLAICLGTDPRRGDQMVRGSVSLPHGTGNEVKVGVFAPPDVVEAALAAGADVAGNDDLISRIQESGGSRLGFDKVLATPDMMKSLGKVARILGPRGLMPNPKLGTIVDPASLPEAIKEMKRGRIEFRADKGSVVHVPIGKVNFEEDKLMENVGALMDGILSARPQKLKGSGASNYILRMYVSSTMGPSIPVMVQSAVTARLS